MKKLRRQIIKHLFEPVDLVLCKFVHQNITNIKIHKPIFIIGPERSGTSLLYSILSHHPDLYWLCALDTQFPRATHMITIYRKLKGSFEQNYNNYIYHSIPNTIGCIEGTLPPSEALAYWKTRFLWKADDAVENDCLDEKDVCRDLRKAVVSDMKIRLKLSKRKRLLFKQPGLSLKIKYFNVIFPSAIFVHCIRNPVDNIVSLVRAKSRSYQDFWGIKIPKWKNLSKVDRVLQAALQLDAVSDIIETDIKSISEYDKRYFQIRYEDILSDPVKTVGSLLSFCDLDFPGNLQKLLPNLVVQRRDTLKPDLNTTPGINNILFKLSHKYGFDA